jgi:hypothetical protein
LLALDTKAPGSVGDLVHVVEGPAAETYGTGLFLVRPDGYVGWAGDTEDGLAEYADRLGLR